MKRDFITGLACLTVLLTLAGSMACAAVWPSQIPTGGPQVAGERAEKDGSPCRMSCPFRKNPLFVIPDLSRLVQTDRPHIQPAPDVAWMTAIMEEGAEASLEVFKPPPMFNPPALYTLHCSFLF
jgi:hypothetical protein